MQPPDKPKAPSLEKMHQQYLAILPIIERHGRIYFRHRNADQKEELIAEMVALCWEWFRRLTERGKDPTQFPVHLAILAARRVKCGRKFCGQEKSKEVTSFLAQQRGHFMTVTLPACEADLDRICPLTALTDNTVTSPADQAAFRIDFRDWLETLRPRNRDIALDMAVGHYTTELAHLYAISPGRVSQLRVQLFHSWTRFTDATPPGPVTNIAQAA
jgi:hypothetical protein